MKYIEKIFEIFKIIVDCSRDDWKETITAKMVFGCSLLDMYQELELLKRLGPTLPESHPAILSEKLQVLQKRNHSDSLKIVCLSPVNGLL